MKQDIKATNDLDEHGNPAGGYVTGVGLTINWQNGPLGRGEDRAEPNGCFVETVLEAALQRIEHYQTLKFKCVENANAIMAINDALRYLDGRTKDREAQEVEGTHGVRPGKDGGS